MSDSAEQEGRPLMLGGVMVETEEARAGERTRTPRAVVVTSLEIPFGNLVSFTLKLALAAIPALLVLALAGGMVGELLRAMFR